MCTALRVPFGGSYLGRTLDLDRSYGEEIVVLPRRYPLLFRHMGEQRTHHAMIGMATVVADTPLLYDAVNEHGLAMAGLNFPENAYYAPVTSGKDNIASFEVIPWILAQAKTVGEALPLLERMNLCDTAFLPSLPPSPLHFILADTRRTVVVEPTHAGLLVYDDPAGVLTNNPPFPYQMESLRRYDGLRTDNTAVTRNADLPYSDYCQGLGAVGLPGDASSMSRFVRAAFGVRNAAEGETEEQNVLQVMKLLSSVEMIRGLVKTDEGHPDTTVYKVAVDQARGIYHYTTEWSHTVRSVALHRCEIGGEALARFPLVTSPAFLPQN